MNFNLTKCNIMTITRSTADRPACYYIKKHKLENISSHKYLGIIIQDDLQWDSHVREVKAKATKILELLRRNLSHCSSKVKEQAYDSLVRPRVEYTTPAWFPYVKQHIASIEALQRSALRFITGDYSRYSSVTSVRETLGWETLACRRHLAAATIYKSINNLIYFPIPDSVRPADPRTRSNHPYKLRHIAKNTNAYKYSFFHRIIHLWNSLPVIFVTATSPEAFQTHALPIIRTICYNIVCT